MRLDQARRPTQGPCQAHYACSTLRQDSDMRAVVCIEPPSWQLASPKACVPSPGSGAICSPHSASTTHCTYQARIQVHYGMRLCIEAPSVTLLVLAIAESRSLLFGLCVASATPPALGSILLASSKAVGRNAALMGPLGHVRQRQRTGCITRRGSPHPGTSARQSSERPASRAMRLLGLWRSVWPVQAKTDASRVATSKDLPFRGLDSRACGCLARYPPELPALLGDEIRVKWGLDFIAQETIYATRVPLGPRPVQSDYSRNVKTIPRATVIQRGPQWA